MGDDGSQDMWEVTKNEETGTEDIRREEGLSHSDEKIFFVFVSIGSFLVTESA